MGVLAAWDVFPTIRLLVSTGALLPCGCQENVFPKHTYLARFSRWSIWPRLHDWSSSCTPRGPFVVGPSGVRQGFIFVRLRTRALRDLGTYENVWGMYIGASWDGLGPQDGAVRSSHARSCVRTTLTSCAINNIHYTYTLQAFLFCSVLLSFHVCDPVVAAVAPACRLRFV